MKYLYLLVITLFLVRESVGYSFGSTVANSKAALSQDYRYLLPSLYSHIDQYHIRLSSTSLSAKRKSKAKPPKGKVWRQSVLPPLPRNAASTSGRGVGVGTPLRQTVSPMNGSAQDEQEGFPTHAHHDIEHRVHNEEVKQQRQEEEETDVNEVMNQFENYLIQKTNDILHKEEEEEEQEQQEHDSTKWKANTPQSWSAIRAPEKHTKAKWTDDYGSVTGVLLASFLSWWEFGLWEGIITVFLASYVVSIREVSGIGKLIRDMGTLVYDSAQVVYQTIEDISKYILVHLLVDFDQDE